MEITSPAISTFKLRTREASILAELNKVTISSAKRESDFEIAAPGEYELLNVSVFAYRQQEALVFLISADGLNLVYAGSQTNKLPEELFDQIDEVAVLFVPSLESAAIRQAEPHYLILTQPNSSVVPQDKLIVQPGKLPDEKGVVVLNGRS